MTGETSKAAHELICVDGIDPAALSVELVDQSTELVLVVDEALEVVAANQAYLDALGYTADELLGVSALDLVDPADHERAFIAIEMSTATGSVGGSALFGLRRADGSTLPADVIGCHLELDGRRYLAVQCRAAYMPPAISELLDRLLANDPLTTVIAPMLDFFAWRENGSQVAICWKEGDALHAVDTGLPASLTGAAARPGDPWDTARCTGAPVTMDDLADLGDSLRADANEVGVHAGWVVPVAAARFDVPALITVWTSRPWLRPVVHSYGVWEAARYLEMALRWTDQVARLDDAAHRDALTGVANRRAFFDALRVGRSGAVLYCDLDGFKPVNDRFGHAAGDALLAEVARRIGATVRAGDLVARLGGDEFAVALWGASPEEAEQIAGRLRVTFSESVEIGGATVAVGMSIGVAHDPVRITPQTLEHADAALYAEKGRRRTDGADTAVS